MVRSSAQSRQVRVLNWNFSIWRPPQNKERGADLQSKAMSSNDCATSLQRQQKCACQTQSRRQLYCDWVCKWRNKFKFKSVKEYKPPSALYESNWSVKVKKGCFWNTKQKTTHEYIPPSNVSLVGLFQITTFFSKHKNCPRQTWLHVKGRATSLFFARMK